MTRLVQIYTEREHQILGGGFILLLIIAWESVPHLVTLPRALSLFFTTPSKVSETFYELVVQNEFQTHFVVSAVEFLLGLGLAILAGLPLGLIMGRSAVADAMFDPYVTALNATPRIVFLPLLILWLGLGIWSKVMIVFIGALFPLLINTYEGVKNVDRVLVNVVRSFGANEWQVMKMVVLPNSLPRQRLPGRCRLCRGGYLYGDLADLHLDGKKDRGKPQPLAPRGGQDLLTQSFAVPL
ncbi:MAG: ABC transporter permease subunit [Deltaproteobacteria bacterium]|nr:ABC transporter permease subunit [Deltaproteobacteria bacterium]